MDARSDNLWWDTVTSRAPAPPVAGTVRTAVAVVGAGIMGSAVALHLAERGVSVALVEAGEVGEGASSRPGGFVVPHFSVGSPEAVRARMGEGADRLIPLVGGSAEAVFALVLRLGIACDARQGGWHHPAAGAPALARVRALAAQWAAAGFPGELLSAGAVAERTGVAGYAGGWFAPSGGTLHPLLYCRGLADAATAQGARLFERSPVGAIERAPGGYRLATPGGAVLAERVLVCTNGLSSALVPPLAAAIVPLRVWQCATEPLPPERLRHLFARGEGLSDTQRNLFTYRVDPDGRLITGALASFGVGRARVGLAMARRLARMLALPEVPRLGHLWSGDGSLSAGRLPVSVVASGGIVSASACNARGIALSTVIGAALAAHVADGAPLPVPVLAARSAGNARLQARLSRFYPHLAPVLDWLDARRHA